MNVDELVTAYINIREERERLTREYEAEDAKLEETMDQIKAQMLKICNETKSDGFTTAAGTATKILRKRYYTSDWDNFGKFVIENNLVALLERRIHQKNFEEYYAEHKSDGLPPGVNVMREFDIQVRKK